MLRNTLVHFLAKNATDATDATDATPDLIMGCKPIYEGDFTVQGITSSSGRTLLSGIPASGRASGDWQISFEGSAIMVADEPGEIDM